MSAKPELISVNVGLPRTVPGKGRPVITGIFKEPVGGSIRLRFLNLEGDGQADLSVHGGPDKAVYAYPSEHYAYWSQKLPDHELPLGMFGENFTIKGLREDSVNIGDRFRIGSAELVVTQPRLPCYKLALKFGRGDMVKRFLASGRTGFYLRVLKEGSLQAGGRIEPIAQDKNDVTVTAITRLYTGEHVDPEMFERALQVEALSASWRRDLLKKRNKRRW